MSSIRADLVSAIEALVDRGEIAGAALAVNRGDRQIWHGAWGFSDLRSRSPVTGGTVFQLASMTKPIVAVAALALTERGLLELDSPIARYLPGFAGITVRGAPLRRAVTVRDLLSHSSGLGMSPEGTAFAVARSRPGDTLAVRMDRWAEAAFPADFQPGTAAGYSAVVGFDILGRILELASGMELSALLRQTILEPLGMTRTEFPGNPLGMARLYQPADGVLLDVTDAPGVLQPFEAWHSGYCSGSAGLCSTLDDYNRFVRMLAAGGTLHGRQILRPETAAQLHVEGARCHLEPFPGCSWGLGMLIFAEPARRNLAVAPGTYGWSGAYGCHFFLDPSSGLNATFMMNRADIGGADSPIARLIESLVFSAFLD